MAGELESLTKARLSAKGRIDPKSNLMEEL